MKRIYKIDTLARMGRPHNGHSRVFAMLHAYLDESGIHDRAVVCVVCGFFGGQGQWRKFEEKWLGALDDYEVPLAEFHAKDFIRRKGFFVTWGSDKMQECLHRLTEAVTRYKIHPVGFGIVVQDFFSFSQPQRRFMTGATLRDDGQLVSPGCPERPYFVPSNSALKNVASHAPVGGRADFYFGLDKHFSTSAMHLFRHIKTRPKTNFRERLGEIAFPLAKETPQLQAADLLSYLTYAHMIEGTKTGDWASSNCSEFLAPLLRRRIVREDIGYLRRENLQETLSQFEPATRL